MRIIRRYIFKEITAPTIISLLIFTFVMVMDVIFEIAELALKKNLGLTIVTKLFLLNLPHIIVLTIPMAVLLGTIVAFSRLSADSEIVAFRSAGISLYKLLQPTLLFALFTAIITGYLMIFFLPWGNKTLLRLQEDIFSISITSVVEPRVFYDDFPGKVIYFNDYAENGTSWKGVFLADSSSPEGRQIINAAEATLYYEEETDQLWLHMKDGSIHLARADEPDEFQFNRFDELQVLIKDGVLRESRLKSAQAEIHDPKLRARTTRELLEVAAQSRTPELKSRYNLAWVNIHKKFSIPASCFILALIGISLGISNSRGGKSSGFAMAIGIIIVYWILIDSGEALAVQVKIPPSLGMWMPNIILGLAGAVFLVLRSRNRNFDFSEMAASLWMRVTARYSRRQAAMDQSRRVDLEDSGVMMPTRRHDSADAGRFGSPGDGDVNGGKLDAPGGAPPVRPAAPPPAAGTYRRLPRRLYIPFPNILDRYILTEYMKVFLMVLLGLIALFVIVDFFQIMDRIIKNNITASTVLRYYQFYLPQITFFIMLVINLITTLVTFGIFSKHNEITAIKGGGISLYRTSLPLILVALVSCVFCFYLEERILPHSNQEHDRLKDQIKGKPPSSHYRIHKWIFGEDGNRVYNYENVNFERGTMAGLSVFEFSPVDFSLKKWTYGRHAVYEDGAWNFRNGWSKTFARGEEVSYEDFKKKTFTAYREPPTYFIKEWKEPEQMNWRELADYMDELRRSGYEVEPELEVDFHSKFSMPFVPLVMSILGISFAFKMGKRGSLYGIGISITLAIIYWVLIAFSSQLGSLGALPPLLAAWAPNIFFGIGGLYMILTLRT